MGFNGGFSFGTVLADNVTLEKTGNTLSIKTGYLSGKVQEVYSGTGLDSTGGGVTSHEMTAISDVGDADYIRIDVVGTSSNVDSAGGGRNNSISIDTKEIGEAYVNRLSATNMSYAIRESATDEGRASVGISYIHTLTAGEKANGIQVRVNVNVASGGTYTGKQIALTLI